MIVSYNKDQKVFVEEPVCVNTGLSKVNLSGSIDKKLKGSTLFQSAISGYSEDIKGNKIKSKS